MKILPVQFFLSLVVISLCGCDLRTFNDNANEQSSKVERGQDHEGGGSRLNVSEVAPNPSEIFSDVEMRKKGGVVYSYTGDGYLEVQSGTAGEAESIDMWVFHHPLEGVEDTTGQKVDFLRQFIFDDGAIYLWAKTPTSGRPTRVVCYFTTDGNAPRGGGGSGLNGAQVADFTWAHNSPNPEGGTFDWWKLGPLKIPQTPQGLRYKIGAFTVEGN